MNKVYNAGGINPIDSQFLVNTRNNEINKIRRPSIVTEIPGNWTQTCIRLAFEQAL